MKMPEFDLNNFQKDIILKDMETIQKRISDFDNHSLLIKGWGITLWSAILIYSLNLMKTDIIIVGIFGLFVFWFFEALYKLFQRSFVVRSIELSNYFKGVFFNPDSNVLKESEIKKTPLPLYNPHGDHSDKDLYDKYHDLSLCILLRVVSVIYIFLFSFSFFIACFISISINTLFFLSWVFWVYGSLGILFLIFAIVIYFRGKDVYIEKINKKRWISIIIILLILGAISLLFPSGS